MLKYVYLQVFMAVFSYPLQWLERKHWIAIFTLVPSVTWLVSEWGSGFTQTNSEVSLLLRLSSYCLCVFFSKGWLSNSMHFGASLCRQTPMGMR